MSLNIKTASIPTRTNVGRKAMPNPFDGLFPSDSEALVLTIAEPEDSTEANRIKRQAREAAHKVDRSPQVVTEPTEDGGTKFTVWTVERVVRKAKDEAPEVSEVTEAE